MSSTERRILGSVRQLDAGWPALPDYMRQASEVPSPAEQFIRRLAQGPALRAATKKASRRAEPLGERSPAPSGGPGFLQRTFSGGGAAVTATRGLWRTVSGPFKKRKKPVSPRPPVALIGRRALSPRRLL